MSLTTHNNFKCLFDDPDPF